MAAGWVVVLNGAPRSGKSSIAAVIQETFDGPWMNLGVDVFSRQVTPPRYRPGMGLRPGGGERPDIEAPTPPETSGALAASCCYQAVKKNVGSLTWQTGDKVPTIFGDPPVSCLSAR